MAELTTLQKETLRKLTKEYGLTKDHFHNHKHYIIIKRVGIEKIQTKAGILVEFEPTVMEREFCVVKAKGYGEYYDPVETFGSASPETCQNKYYPEMAEKRALSRVVLKMTQFYQLPDVIGEDETPKE